MRAVLFLFAMLETVFNLFCMAYHISGFFAVDTAKMGLFSNVMHYIYMVTFYFFTVLTLFASIKLCTGYKPLIWHEINRTCIASFVFILVAILTMYDAEKYFHLLYLDSSEDYEPMSEPIHPFFQFQRAQSIASLSCGVLYMLHATIAIDVFLSTDDDDDEDEEEPDIEELEEGEIMPIKLYVFGEVFQKKLEKFQWFREFSTKGDIEI